MRFVGITSTALSCQWLWISAYNYRSISLKLRVIFINFACQAEQYKAINMKQKKLLQNKLTKLTDNKVYTWHFQYFIKTYFYNNLAFTPSVPSRPGRVRLPAVTIKWWYYLSYFYKLTCNAHPTPRNKFIVVENHASIAIDNRMIWDTDSGTTLVANANRRAPLAVGDR